MLELEIKNLTAAITRLADLMEQADDDCEIVVVDVVEGKVVSAYGNEVITPTKFERAPDVEPEQDEPDDDAAYPTRVADYVAMRQVAQDLCLRLVREDRDNKVTIGDWLGANSAKTIKQLDDCFLDGFIHFLEGLAK